MRIETETGWTQQTGGTLRNRVREAREHLLMTQTELASKARVALRTLHSVERGMNCRHDTKRKLLAALEFSFEDRDLVFPPGAEVTIRRSRVGYLGARRTCSSAEASTAAAAASHAKASPVRA